MRRNSSPLVLAVLLALAPAAAGADELADQLRIEKARKLFELWLDLGHSFDARIIELYDPAAKVEVLSRGEEDSQSLRFTVAQLRTTMPTAMAEARKRNDVDRFTEVKFELAGDNVRISGIKACPVRAQDNPFALLVGPDASGTWVVLEEHGEYRVKDATGAMMQQMSQDKEKVRRLEDAARKAQDAANGPPAGEPGTPPGKPL